MVASPLMAVQIIRVHDKTRSFFNMFKDYEKGQIIISGGRGCNRSSPQEEMGLCFPYINRMVVHAQH